MLNFIKNVVICGILVFPQQLFAYTANCEFHSGIVDSGKFLIHVYNGVLTQQFETNSFSYNFYQKNGTNFCYLAYEQGGYTSTMCVGKFNQNGDFSFSLESYDGEAIGMCTLVKQ